MAKKVLVVDDQAHVRNILDFNLKRMGYEVTAVPDGETALKEANSKPYDVILLDIMLPGIDGVEVLDILQKTAIPTPVIVISARGEQNDIVLALQAGAKDYVVKPYSMEILFQKIAKQVFQSGEQDKKDKPPEVDIGENVTQKLSSLTMLVLNGDIIEDDIDTLSEMIDNYFKVKQYRFIIDMSRVNDIRSLAIGKLIKIKQNIEKNNGDLFILLPHENLQILFKETNFYKSFKIYETPGELIKAL